MVHRPEPRTLTSFKHATRLNLKDVTSRVKPGMLIQDDANMTLVLREKVKAEYLDFAKMQKQVHDHRQRCQSATARVPGHRVEPAVKGPKRNAYKPTSGWKLDLSKVKSSIPKATGSPIRSPIKKVVSNWTLDKTKVKTSIPKPITVKRVTRVRKPQTKPDFEAVVFE